MKLKNAIELANWYEFKLATDAIMQYVNVNLFSEHNVTLLRRWLKKRMTRKENKMIVTKGKVPPSKC